jgi:hypothetical protein
MTDAYFVRVVELRAPLLVAADRLMKWGICGYVRGRYTNPVRWLSFKGGSLAYRLDRLLFGLGLVR